MKNISILLLLITFTACNNAKDKAADSTQTETTEIATANKNATLITDSSAGQFILGQSIPQSLPGYEIKKQMRLDEEGSEYPYYTISENGKAIVNLIPAYDMEEEDYSMIIEQIEVVSDKFRTAENIGVNSTIKEFKEKYPDLSFSYGYISDRYIIETPKYNLQFKVDEKGFIGKLNVTSDSQNLKESDFTPDCKINEIIIY